MKYYIRQVRINLEDQWVELPYERIASVLKTHQASDYVWYLTVLVEAE